MRSAIATLWSARDSGGMPRQDSVGVVSASTSGITDLRNANTRLRAKLVAAMAMNNIGQAQKPMLSSSASPNTMTR